MTFYAPREPMNLGHAIDLMTIEMLRGWLGRGEVGGNNRGAFVASLTHGFVGAWCAALQWSALDAACDVLGYVNPIVWSRRVHSARHLLAAYAQAGRTVEPEDIRAGDYLCFARALPWQGHALRVAFGVWPFVVIIDGNSGSYARTRGAVRQTPMDLRDREIVGVARLG